MRIAVLFACASAGAASASGPVAAGGLLEDGGFALPGSRLTIFYAPEPAMLLQDAAALAATGFTALPVEHRSAAGMPHHAVDLRGRQGSAPTAAGDRAQRFPIESGGLAFGLEGLPPAVISLFVAALIGLVGIDRGGPAARRASRRRSTRDGQGPSAG